MSDEQQNPRQSNRPSVRKQASPRARGNQAPNENREGSAGPERRVSQSARHVDSANARRSSVPASNRAATQRQASSRQAAYQPVTYRKAQQDESHKRLMRAVYGAAAAVVVVAVAFGIMAFTHNGSSAGGQAGNDPLAQSVVADVQGAEGSQAANATASAITDDAQLAARAQDFAVDPNRTDWNYSTNGKKTVYLTIDDGPSAMTPQVLDILDRYGCKATFFVVGHNDDYFPYIAEAFKRGHTIGLHSMTHDYSYVYSSVDNYYQDLADVGEVVREQIGFVPCFIRFPGGSSNAVSADYSAGIMTTLSEDVQAKGYQYYDWNLSVGDGSEHTADEIAEYGMADEGNENIMLLCHDSATKQATVDALPRIIEHYQSLGYTFEAIDRSSWVCHHGVNN